MQPLRQRTGFDADPLHQEAKALEKKNERLGIARDLRFLHNLSRAVDHTDGREFQRNLNSSIVSHGCPPSRDVWGLNQPRPPFHHHTGTGTPALRLGAGPLRHLYAAVWREGSDPYYLW